MPAKKVSFGKKPAPEEPQGDRLNEWVTHRERQESAEQPHLDQPEKMKRLTLDIPEPLHRAIKRKAVDEGVTMVELLRSLLEQHFDASS
jgi:predicted DNA binding CopG/RHH family protein